jgi:hypothetical protein
VFDLIAEVTQSCTVSREGTVFDMNGGRTLVIDPRGRSATPSTNASTAPPAPSASTRDHRPPARWIKKGRHLTLRPEMLRRLHGLREPASGSRHATTRRRSTSR